MAIIRSGFIIEAGGKKPPLSKGGIAGDTLSWIEIRILLSNSSQLY